VCLLPIGLTLVTCPSCRVEWQWPRVTSGGLEELYERSYYDAWGLHADEPLVRRMKRKTFEQLLAQLEAHVAPGRLLDVGCATGFLLQTAQARGWDPFGVELSAYASGVARRRFGDERIVHGPLEGAAFSKGFFQAITMTDFIEHVPDPVGTLRKAHFLLRPDGILCLSTPMVGSLSHRLMGRRWTHYKAEHLQYYSPQSLQRHLQAAGFKMLSHRSWPKTVTLEYARSQFDRYRHWLISPAIRLLSASVPPPMRAWQIRVPLGDMLVLASPIASVA
jgi:2-polyprenyl-3-methyl-5-hydroxy-6-metoxy-1,4-benzoquinol methylase